MSQMEVITVGSLEKVMPSVRPVLTEKENTCFRNQTFSFQVAYCEQERESFLKNCFWEVEGPLKEYVTVRPVALIPCTTPRSAAYDDYYSVENAALVPDVLRNENFFYARYREWGALWVTVRGSLPAGKNVIRIQLKTDCGELLGVAEYELNVLNAELPRTDFGVSHWFHYDSVAEYYGVQPFDAEFYEIFDEFLRNAAAHGVDTWLVPLFTPPLNTGAGRERTTSQLVIAESCGGEYKFDFSRLEAFIDRIRAVGIRRLEMSHLFTQWGAEFAPKIMVRRGGKLYKEFGNGELALGDKYKNFLRAFLPSLVDLLKRKGISSDECYFHISDEPNGTHLPHYLQIREFIKPLLGEYPIFDALSDFSFFKQGAVDIPVVCTDSAEKFIEARAPFWAYYCTGQGSAYLSNRFLSMPLQRTRIIGLQLYLSDCRGFLHWGYNYYNSALSERYIDPYQVTDADGSFQSGDSFIVYPVKRPFALNGGSAENYAFGRVADSVRHEIFYDAIQDYRALKFLELLVGRDCVVNFLREEGVGKTFEEYPHSAVWHTEFRQKLNARIISALS